MLKLKQFRQLGQAALTLVVVAAVAMAMGFLLSNVFSAKPISCYLSFERPCYEKWVGSGGIRPHEMNNRVGEKLFNTCAKDSSAVQGTSSDTSELCNQKLYQFDVPYVEEVKYCSSKATVVRRYEGNCIPPIIIPRIYAFNPASGPIGTRVTISGSGFTSSDNYLVLGHPLGPAYIPVSLSSSDGRIMTFTVPNTVSLLTSCSPLDMGTNAYCKGEPLKEVAITPGEYSIMVINANGFQSYYGAPVKFTVTATNQ